MTYYNLFDPEKLKYSAGHASCSMLGAEQGAVGDCEAGISIYDQPEFPTPLSHTFQEGFYVIAGEGMAMVGEEVFPIRQGMCFLVPRNTPHTLCSQESVTVFWFHCT